MKKIMLVLGALAALFFPNSKILAQDDYDYSASDNGYSYDTSYDDDDYVATDTSASSDDVSDVSYFYDKLAPYGTWINDPQYGYVWEPSVAVTDPSWRPYVSDGSWAYTDAGWYWNSRYDWGWAPYHYGRWYYRDHWRWLPGTVWGPSWVSWRYGDGFYGWAPLPPAAVFYPGVGFSYYGHNFGFNVGFGFGLGVNAFAFVPASSFLSFNLGFAVLPSWRVNSFWGHTHFANNFGYRGGVFVNNGIAVRDVSRATGRTITPLRVTSASRGSLRTQVRGNTIVTPRPALRSGRPSMTPQQSIARARTRTTQPRATRPGTTARRTPTTGARNRAAPGVRQPTRRTPTTTRQGTTRQPSAAARTNRRALETPSRTRVNRHGATPATPATPRARTGRRTVPATRATPAHRSTPERSSMMREHHATRAVPANPRASTRAATTPSRSASTVHTRPEPRSTNAARAAGERGGQSVHRGAAERSAEHHGGER